MEDSQDKIKDYKCTTFCYSVSLNTLAVLSLLGSISWTIYEINDKILIDDENIPEPSFVLDIAGVIFSLSLLAGIHKSRLDYMTPYFLTSLILSGYFSAISLTIVSRWELIPAPVTALLISLALLVLSFTNVLVLFKYMERLKADQGIRSTWSRVRRKNRIKKQRLRGQDTDLEDSD